MLTWYTLRRMKDATRMKVLVKGIESPDADGVIVSNHGGRATESGRDHRQPARGRPGGIMAQCGKRSLAEIGPTAIVSARA